LTWQALRTWGTEAGNEAWRDRLPSTRTDEHYKSQNTVAATLREMGYPRDIMSAQAFRAMARTILDEVVEWVDLTEHQLARTVIDAHRRPITGRPTDQLGG
jgi:hypothetical protein